MSQLPPIALTPVPIESGSSQFRELYTWNFSGVDAFVTEILQKDIPQRMVMSAAQFWIYRNPAGEIVGFGCMEVSDLYAHWANHRPHPYIPLLAVKPQIKSYGYGTSILTHLMDEAALIALSEPRHEGILFLDVFTTSERAITLYKKCGFENLTRTPISDGDSGKEYLVMARRVSIPRPGLFNSLP